MGRAQRAPTKHPKNLCAFAPLRSLREKKYTARKVEEMTDPRNVQPFVSSGQASGRLKDSEKADKQKKCCTCAQHFHCLIEHFQLFHNSAYSLAAHHIEQITRFVHVKHDNGQVVFLT